MQHTNGKFYGSTESGALGFGELYSLDDGLGSFAALVPAAGGTSATVTILGSGLTGSSKVCFSNATQGCASASFSVKSDTYIIATVPSGAVTGPVQVTTPGGALNSNVSFQVVR